MFNSKKYQKEYRNNHREKFRKYQRKYYLKHQIVIQKRWRKWVKENPEKIKEIGRKFRKNHPERVREVKANYKKTERGKETNKRNLAKRRRKLGFVPLNKPFSGCVGHHIDREKVIYIPEKLHNSVHHSVILNQNMDKINSLAFGFLRSQKAQGFLQREVE